MPELDQPGEDAGTIDVAAITKTVTQQVAESFRSQLDELAKNQKILADTLSEDQKRAAQFDPDAVSRIVQEAIEARSKAAAEAEARAAERKGLIDRIVADKLGGDGELGSLLSGEDEAALLASAEKLAAKIRTFRPDFGGAAKDGGTPPGGGDGEQPKKHLNLSPGTAAFAQSITLPA